MKKYDRLAAILLIALGLGTSVYSYALLKVGTLTAPDAGFQPFLAGVGMVICAAVWLAARMGKDDVAEPFWGKGEWVRPLLAAVFLVVYTFAMDIIGYIAATFLFMAVWQLLIERERWLKASIITVLSTAGVYLLFVYFLGVPVPEGILGL